jgi:hypothetical protein
MSTLTGVTAIDNTLTGVEDLYLDELEVSDVTADNITSTAVSSTSLSSTTISLGGNDLQTTLNNLQAQIIAPSTGGGYFIVTAEYNGNWTQGGYFSFAGVLQNNLPVSTPNCTLTGYSVVES